MEGGGGLKIGRKKTVHMMFNRDGNWNGNSLYQSSNISFGKSDNILISRIYTGIELRLGCEDDAYTTIKMEQTGQWECLHDGSMTINGVRCEDMGSEESTREDVGCGGHGDVDMDVWSHQ